MTTKPKSKVTAEVMLKDALRPIDEALQSEGLDLAEFAKVMKELRNAKDIKVFHNKDTGIVYSKKLRAYGPRAEFARIYAGIAGLLAPSSAKLEHSGGVSFTVTHESPEPVRKSGDTPKKVVIADDLDG